MAAQHRVLWAPVFFLPESWNGIDEHLLLLSRRLDRERFEPLVLEHETDGPQTAELGRRAGIAVLRAPYGRHARLDERVRHLAALLRRERIDLLHVHSPSASGQLAFGMAARLAGVRSVLSTCHQVQAWRMPLRTRLVNRLHFGLLVQRAVAVSQDVARTLREHAGVAAAVEVIANGVELDDAGCATAVLPPRRPGELRVGYFGRLSPEKGVDTLIEAVALLKDSLPELRLYVAGEGPQRSELEALAGRLGARTRVCFLGYRPEGRALMGEVDIVAHVPRYEGFGLAMIEAMAAGLPLAVNDGPGGMRELVQHEVNGLVVPAGSAPALAGALERLGRDAGLRARLGAAGRAICAERYSATRMAESIQRLYDELLAQRLWRR